MSDPKTTRGARKLQAAIDGFGLAPRIARAQALDVGASTGGFCATLLERGARHVTAIEVGHGQLAEALRADLRITLHERTDFRRAPLALAEGPFDFFTVDVSFMAARNTLRPLAFRLRDGAEGIVLLKPQFELAAHAVRDGDVSDPELRRKAFARFEARARTLGFRVIAQRDSEVAGGSGTVEIFLHLRFEGRPVSLPRPGERREAAPQPQARPRPRQAEAAPALDALTCFAIAAPGLEPALREELGEIPGVREPREIPGGVEFAGGLAAAFAVNLHSRIATRVLIRLGTVSAHQFSELRRRLEALPFDRFIEPGRPLRIDVSARRCRLYHTKALAETVQLALGDRLGCESPLAPRASDDDAEVSSTEPFGREPFSRVLLRGDNDRFTVSVDSTGLLLHRRGARALTGRAPLRETLAAGLLRIAGYRGDAPFVDAMCGAGTIALEAGAIALGRAPGGARSFACEAFPCFEPAAAAAQRQAALAGEHAASEPIVAFDRDARAVATARRNAERAQLGDLLQLTQGDLLRYRPPAPQGLLVANPPYGKRIGGAAEVRDLYRAIGSHLRDHFGGWRVALLVPRATPPALLGLGRCQRFALWNGGVAVSLLVGEPDTPRRSARTR